MSDILKSMEQFGKTGDEVEKTANSVTATIGRLSTAMETLGNGIKKGTTGFDDMVSAGQNITSALTSTGSALSSIIGLVPELGATSQIMSTAFSMMGGFSKGLSNVLSDGIKEIIRFGDSTTKAVREVDSSMFELTKSFGFGIDAARDLTDSMPAELLSDFGRSINLSQEELRGFIEASKGTGLQLSQLTGTVATAYGNMNLYTLAAAQSSAAGISASEGARMLDSMMNRQGMSAKTATETIAGFSAIAKETGITFSDVSSTLNNAAENFKKIGMTADFGRPLLESFAKTVKEVGLGIDVATEATSSLISALGGLSDNYGLAYLTQAIGGGGATGGVLGTSIQMRQQMREAEETGGQGAMALEMAKQMKDTIASMTGGNIITLQQAAESPDLQSQFYMQEQLLQQYGINDTGTQDAVLDLLSKIDQATAMGDTQGQAELADQLSREVEGRDKTMDEMEKVQIALGSLEAEFNKSTRAFGEYTREIISKTGGDITRIAMGGVISSFTEEFSKLNLSKTIGEDQKQAIYDALKTVAGNVGMDLTPDKTIDKDDPNSTMYEGFKKALEEVFSKGQTVKIELTPDAQKLFVATNPKTLNTGPGTPVSQ